MDTKRTTGGEANTNTVTAELNSLLGRGMTERVSKLLT